MLLDNNTRLFGMKKVSDDNRYKIKNREVLLRYVTKINFNDKQLQEQHQYAHITLVDLLTRHLEMTREERVYYDRRDQAQERIEIDPRLRLPKMNAWLGYRITFESTTDGMALFIDPKHRLMEERSVRDAMDQIHNKVKAESRRMPE